MFKNWKSIKNSLHAMALMMALTLILVLSSKSYAANECKITFDPNGGDAVNPTSITVEYEQKIGDMPIPTKEGFTFAGWSKTKTGAADYVTATMVNHSTKDYTVYARWNKTVSFVSNGGTAIPDRTYLLGTAYGQLPTPQKSGYRFVGWYYDKARKDTRVYNYENVRNVSVLYAQWEKVTGTFKKKTCHDKNGTHAAKKHIAKYTVNSTNVKKLRKEVSKASYSKQKVAALYALDAVGSYYCQQQRKTSGAYDCGSLVGRAYLYAGDTTFKGLPGTKEMLSRLKNLAKKGKAVRVTNGKYKTGDIMFSNDNKHVSIYIAKMDGKGYRVAAEKHSTGVGYFKASNTKYTYVYRFK